MVAPSTGKEETGVSVLSPKIGPPVDLVIDAPTTEADVDVADEVPGTDEDAVAVGTPKTDPDGGVLVVETPKIEVEGEEAGPPKIELEVTVDSEDAPDTEVGFDGAPKTDADALGAPKAGAVPKLEVADAVVKIGFELSVLVTEGDAEPDIGAAVF